MPERPTINSIEPVPTSSSNRSAQAVCPDSKPTGSGADVGVAKPLGALRVIVPVLVGLLMTLVLLTFPRLPLGTNDDSSWAAVLGYGHQAGLQFGRDLVFTYGPYGFLITPYFSPQAPFLRLVADVLVTATTAAGMSLLAWRLKTGWRWLLLLLFTFFAANADPRTELLLYTGLFAWGMLCLIEARPAFLCGLALVAVFCSLAKVSFLFLAGLTVVAVALDLGLRGKARLARFFAGGTLALFLLSWLAAGQQLGHLGAFLANAMAISFGYQQAMATEEFRVLTWSALLMILCTVSAMALTGLQQDPQTGKSRGWRQAVRLSWLAGVIFLVWKHGFIRAGRDHMEIFLGLVPTLAVTLAALPNRSRMSKVCAGAAAIACCAVGLFALQWLFDGNIRSCLSRPVEQLATHVGVLLRPGQYWSRMNEMQRAESAAAQLPRVCERIGRASVDVFGFNQAYALFNRLNFRPRPVFQSYAAYTERLMQLNEQFYSSPAAPDYVLFRLNAIDDQFPPLQDALVFRRLLLDYTPVDAEGPFLLLKARQQTPADLQLLGQGDIRPGELLDMTKWPAAGVWLSLQLEPSWLGRIRTFLYQPAKVELGVWVPGNARLKMGRFRAPVPMLAAGFLANPLQLENQDVLDLYVGKPVARAVAYSIELPPGTQSLWQNRIHFKVYRIQNQLGNSAGPELAGLLTFPGFEAAPEKVEAGAARILPIGGKLALALVGGGALHFRVPEQAKAVKGSFGYAALSYLLGGSTQGGEFRIEEQLPDGTVQLLYFQTLKPLTNLEDRGMKPFEVACPGTGERHLILRTVPLPGGNPARELPCWANIGFE